MAGRIRQEDIEAVRERIDLAKVVSGYLTLRKAGHDSLVGLCPFHTEKTASFNVSPSKGLYYCHGCQAGGDAVKFLMGVENLTFREAVERLAQDAGVQLRYEAESTGERRAASKRDALNRANAEASALYHQTLMSSPEAAAAREYLNGRGIDRELVERFEIGYAPASQNFLLRALAKKVSTELLLEAGLAVRDAGGGVRDRFRDRITFPIHDLSGRAVGFGARLLQDVEGQPKYLNTRETPVYDKGRLLYNLHRAKATLTRSGEAYVVEGYTDVIALHQAGVESAIATCGTALGGEHLRLLSRFAQRAVLAFDSDEAGYRAAERAYELHQEHPVEIRVLILPDGLDPADLVRIKGAEGFREVAAEAQPLVRYMIDRTVRRFDLSTVEGRTRAVEGALPLVAGLRDSVSREQYAHHLAERTGASDTAVLVKLQAPGDGRREPEPQGKRVSPQHRVEWEMLKLLAQSADVYEVFSPQLGDAEFDRAQHRKLFELLRTSAGDVRALVAESADDRLTAQFAALATERPDGELNRDYAERVVLRLKEFGLKRQIDRVRKDLQRLNPLKDPQYESMFVELSELEGARRRVREQAERM